MSMLRQDAATEEWVVVAPGRAGRPHGAEDADRPSAPPHDPRCPFCPGNEHRTPPELARTETDESWDQRAFPNLFPALEVGGDTVRGGDRTLRSMPGVGAHEVVVESPRHDDRLDEMAPERIERVLAMWRERSAALKAIPGVEAVVVFKNFGDRAGTSLAHPHSQIVATPVIPPLTRRRVVVAERYREETGRCIYEDMLAAELGDGRRVLLRGEAYVALAPFASRTPFEMRILPRAHRASFEHLDEETLPELARTLGSLLAGLRRAAGDPDFNVVVQSAPAHEETKPSFHWHMDVVPRTTVAAGFELGSGMSINPLPSEAAADALRDALATSRRG